MPSGVLRWLRPGGATFLLHCEYINSIVSEIAINLRTLRVKSDGVQIWRYCHDQNKRCSAPTSIEKIQARQNHKSKKS